MPACGSRVVKGYGADFRRGPRQPRQQPALAAVGSADEHDLPGSLRGNLVADADFFRVLAFVLDFLAQLADLRLEFGLQFLAGLVLGHQRPHLFETLQTFLRRSVPSCIPPRLRDTAASRLTAIVSCPSSVVSCPSSVVSGQLSIVSGPLSVVSGQWSVVSRKAQGLCVRLRRLCISFPTAAFLTTDN